MARQGADLAPHIVYIRAQILTKHCGGSRSPDLDVVIDLIIGGVRLQYPVERYERIATYTIDKMAFYVPESGRLASV